MTQKVGYLDLAGFILPGETKLKVDSKNTFWDQYYLFSPSWEGPGHYRSF